jgi:hypothetical protein
MVDYESAIKKPFSDPKKLLIGTLVNIFPVVNWIAKGYFLENSGLGTRKHSKSMPEWDDWADYFLKGVNAVIIGAVYALPGVIFFLIFGGEMRNAIFRSPFSFLSDMNMMGSGSFSMLHYGPVMSVTMIFFLVAAYLAPLAMLHYLKHKRLSSGFDVQEVLRRTLTVTYLVPWLAFMAYGIVLGFASGLILSLLDFIPKLYMVLGAFATFVTHVFGFTIFGEAYREIK